MPEPPRLKKIGEGLVDIVDVEGRDLHAMVLVAAL
jgi:hypothetical protein